MCDQFEELTTVFRCRQCKLKHHMDCSRKHKADLSLDKYAEHLDLKRLHFIVRYRRNRYPTDDSAF